MPPPHWPNANLFSVSDYFLQQSPTGGSVTWCRADETASQTFIAVHQYRLFGRTADVGGTH